jgi:hypothetical protein
MPDPPLSGIDEDLKEVGGSGWVLRAYVQGEWEFMGRELGVVFHWLYHKGERGAWYSIIYNSPLEVTYMSDQYGPTTVSTDGNYLETSRIYGEFQYGRTRSWSRFHDWISKQTWAVWAPSEDGWAEVP